MVIFFLILPLVSYASVIGSVKTVGKGKLGIGVDGDYVFDRDLSPGAWTTNQTIFSESAGAVQILNRNWDISKPKIDSMYRAAGKVSYGLLDDLDVYLKLGTSQEQIKSSLSGSGSVEIPSFAIKLPIILHDGTLKYDTDNAFTYGGGIKLTHEFSDGWIIGCDSQYLREEYDYKASRDYLLDIPAVAISGIPISEGWEGELITQQWLIAPYIAKKIFNFTPYVGFVYTYLSMKDKSKVPTSFTLPTDNVTDLSTGGYSLKYHNKCSISPFVGLSYKFDDHWNINVEGRFVDETALSVEGNFVF